MKKFKDLKVGDPILVNISEIFEYVEGEVIHITELDHGGTVTDERIISFHFDIDKTLNRNLIESRVFGSAQVFDWDDSELSVDTAGFDYKISITTSEEIAQRRIMSEKRRELNMPLEVLKHTLAGMHSHIKSADDKILFSNFLDELKAVEEYERAFFNNL